MTLREEGGTDITLVPNLLAFRADLDSLDISISVAGKLPWMRILGFCD